MSYPPRLREAIEDALSVLTEAREIGDPEEAISELRHAINLLDDAIVETIGDPPRSWLDPDNIGAPSRGWFDAGWDACLRAHRRMWRRRPGGQRRWPA